MGLTTKKLGELLTYWDSGELVLPEIQREFTWPKKNIIYLFDSLNRELPIGQMLVWKPKITRVHRKPDLGVKRKGLHKASNSSYGYLLDGQQRLTAIARVRDADDEYPLMVDLRPQKEPDVQMFYWDKRLRDSSAWYLPVADVLSPKFDIVAHLERLEREEDYKPSDGESVRKVLTRLQGILDYDISVIEFESEDYEAATDLFIRFNSTGKKLTKKDLAAAALATRVPGLTSRKIAKALDQWKPNFQFTRPFLTQCLVAVHTDRMVVKDPDKLWVGSTPKQIERSWDRTERALDQVIELLTGTVRWNASTWVPSFNALIPLIYICAEKGSLTINERQRARSWLLLTGLRGHFSGAVYTELDNILKTLKKNPSMDKLWSVTGKKTLSKLHPEDFQTTRQSGPAMSLLISMLRNNNARDWINGSPLDGDVLGRNAKLHIHHFFPRALLRKYEYDAMYINTFANLTILTAKTNYDIGMEEPAQYLSRVKHNPADLDAQCLPQDADLWQVSNYENFLNEREKLLAERANTFLGL